MHNLSIYNVLLQDKLWDMTLKKLNVRGLGCATARAVEEIPMVGIEAEDARSEPTFVANHEEIRNIDDVTTEEEDEEQSEGQNRGHDGGNNGEEEKDGDEVGEEKDSDDDEEEEDEDDGDDGDIVESPSK